MLAALLLHAGLIIGGLIVWPWFNKPLPPGSVTAVTLVAGPPAPLRPADQAPEPAPAAAPEPAPEPVPPPPPAPAPKPAPTPPPKPLPTPKPTPAPPKPTTLPAKPAQKDSLDLAALTSSLDRQAAKSDARKAPGVKGPLRPETALTPRLDQGAAQAATTDAAAAVGARLNRIWSKNCGVKGFSDVVIQYRFRLTRDGELDPTDVDNLGRHGKILNPPSPPSAVWLTAADRAFRAVAQAAPFHELPKQTYSTWQTFTAVFDAQEACRNP